MKKIADLIDKYMKLQNKYETITLAEVVKDLRFLQLQNRRNKLGGRSR